ncbi:hypothetical protein ABPG74_010080 [Tetrahymena malaccensis]
MNTYSAYQQIQEIQQANIPDFGLGSISVYNFIASFSQHYPNQARLILDENKSKQVEQCLNICYPLFVQAFFASPLIKGDNHSTGNIKLVLNAWYKVKYSEFFNSFIKSYQTCLQSFYLVQQLFYKNQQQQTIIKYQNFFMKMFSYIDKSQAVGNFTIMQRIQSIFKSMQKSSKFC